MFWTILALTAPALWAVSNLIDANLLDSRIRHATSLLILTGFVAGVPGILLILLGQVSPVDGRTMGVIAAAGFLGLAVYYPYFRALRTATPLDVLLLWNLAPVFVAVAAVLVLNELLDTRQILGGVCLLGSSIVALVQRGSGNRSFRAVGWMLLASLLVGGEAVAEKAVYHRVPFSSGFAWMSCFQLGLALIIGFLHRPAWREVTSCLRSNVFRLVAGNEIIDLVASVARSLAISLGPVSIVHAIGALQPVFLLGAGWFLQRNRAAKYVPRTLVKSLRIGTSVALAVLGMGLIESGR